MFLMRHVQCCFTDVNRQCSLRFGEHMKSGLQDQMYLRRRAVPSKTSTKSHDAGVASDLPMLANRNQVYASPFPRVSLCFSSAHYLLYLPTGCHSLVIYHRRHFLSIITYKDNHTLRPVCSLILICALYSTHFTVASAPNTPRCQLSLTTKKTWTSAISALRSSRIYFEVA